MIALNKDPNYYTPDIDDIFIGYECELNSEAGYTDDWYPYVWRLEDEQQYPLYGEVGDKFDMLLDGYGAIRTKYLTSNQIEENGWGKSEEARFCVYSKNNYWLIPRKDRHCTIMAIDPLKSQNVMGGDGVNSVIFQGKINSINELRKLEKILEI